MVVTLERASDPSAVPLGDDEIANIDAYWRAANYRCVGMIYLRDNPLLRTPLEPAHIKHRLLGHFGSDPGQTFTWAHLNRLIKLNVDKPEIREWKWPTPQIGD